MKISQITPLDLANYCRVDTEDELLMAELAEMLIYAKSYVCQYTGLEEAELDLYDDLSIVVFILVEDFFENRSYQGDFKSTNRTVDTILGLHSVNLL